MKKILMFGGTFNPVHNGHVRLCRMISERIDADLTVIVPTYSPVHKNTGDKLESSTDRLNMCRLAFDGENELVSDMEIAKGRPCYSYETLEELHEIYRDSDIYMACGSDMLLSLHTWRNPERIYELATVCAMSRGDEFATLSDYVQAHRSEGLRAIIIDAPPVELSSTELRNKLENGESIEGLMPDKVAEYIRERGLYSC